MLPVPMISRYAVPQAVIVERDDSCVNSVPIGRQAQQPVRRMVDGSSRLRSSHLRSSHLRSSQDLLDGLGDVSKEGSITEAF